MQHAGVPRENWLVNMQAFHEPIVKYCHYEEWNHKNLQSNKLRSKTKIIQKQRISKLLTSYLFFSVFLLPLPLRLSASAISVCGNTCLMIGCCLTPPCPKLHIQEVMSATWSWPWWEWFHTPRVRAWWMLGCWLSRLEMVKNASNASAVIVSWRVKTPRKNSSQIQRPLSDSTKKSQITDNGVGPWLHACLVWCGSNTRAYQPAHML